MRLGWRQRGLDAMAQFRGGLVPQIVARHRLAHFAIVAQRRRTVLAACNMGFDVARMSGVEFAVNQRVKKDFGFVAGHFGCSCSAIHADRSMARARASRDITVPTGTSPTSAISRYERFWISRSTKVSRNGSPSAPTSRRVA